MSVAIAAHDAGGAEVLSSYVRRQGITARFALSGPAEKIFRRKLGNITNLSIYEAMTGASQLICGTSLPSSFELEAITLARRGGIATTAVLEHWINYRARFERDGATVLPDTIWTLDPEAERLATQALPECRIVRIENPYRLDCLDEIANEGGLQSATAPEAVTTILYVTEPTSEHAARLHGDPIYWGYTEIGALHYFLERQPQVLPSARRLILRPHPSEAATKYANILSRSGLEIQMSHGSSLASDIARSQCVVGCNSMAMVVSGWAGRLTFCAIPPGGYGYSLRAPAIRMLRDTPSIPISASESV